MICTPLRDVGRYDLLPGFRGASGRSVKAGSGVISRAIKPELSFCCAHIFHTFCISFWASLDCCYDFPRLDPLRSASSPERERYVKP